MMVRPDETIQTLCREYLRRLRHLGSKHGIDVSGIIRANKRGECAATRKEVEMLARCVDDERLTRSDVPDVLGKSYRQCVDDGDFERIGRKRRVGIYSKVGAILLRNKRK